MSIYKLKESKNVIDDQYNSMLSKWPIPYESKMVTSRFGDTHILEMGQGDEVVVLLHGSTSNSSMWINEVKSLDNYKVLAIDLPGEPNKSTELRLSLNDNSFVEWLEDCLTHYNNPKFHLIGNSLGGWVALKYASMCHYNLLSLILVAPSGLVPARLSFVFKSIFYLAFGKKGIKKLAKIALGHEDEEVVQVMTMIMKHFNPRMGSLPVFGDDLLRQIDSPVLYLAGDKDQLLKTKESAERLKNLVVRTDIRILNCGHAIYNIGDILSEFIGNVRRSNEAL